MLWALLQQHNHGGAGRWRSPPLILLECDSVRSCGTSRRRIARPRRYPGTYRPLHPRVSAEALEAVGIAPYDVHRSRTEPDDSLVRREYYVSRETSRAVDDVVPDLPAGSPWPSVAPAAARPAPPAVPLVERAEPWPGTHRGRSDLAGHQGAGDMNRSPPGDPRA